MESCSIKIEETKVFKKVAQLLGRNKNLKLSVYVNAVSNGEFNANFLDWYKAKYKTEKVPNYNTEDAKEASSNAQAMIDYYYNNRASVSRTTTSKGIHPSIKIFGYTNDLEREIGIRHASNDLLDIYNNIEKYNIELKGNKLAHYTKRLQKVWLDRILLRASQHSKKDIKQLRKEYVEAKKEGKHIDYLDKALGGKNKNASDVNAFAVFKELHSSPVTINKFMVAALSNKKVNAIYNDIKENIISKDASLAMDADASIEGIENGETPIEQEFDVDDFIKQTLNHIGEFSSTMKHISAKVINYFNSLKKLEAPTIGAFDTNNSYGIAERMDAETCVKMLFNMEGFTNVPTMIRNIENIGKTVPGFEAFIQFAQDLTENYDFATEVYTLFAKCKISKIEMNISNGSPTTRIANTRSDKRTTFVFDARNDIQGTAISNNAETTANQYESLKDTIDIISTDFNKTVSKNTTKAIKETSQQSVDEKLPILKNNVINLVKSYFPSVENAAIKAFIELNNGSTNKDVLGQLANCRTLIDLIAKVAKDSEESIREYNRRALLAVEIREHNNYLDRVRNQNTWVAKEQYRNYSEVAEIDYSSNQDSNIQQLANLLLDYSAINTTLNTRNIHGNNNSDVINVSLIGNLSKMLQRTYIETRDINGKKVTLYRNRELEEWGKAKFRSKQYKHNPLLLEQVDEDGNVLNKGIAIFRYVDGQLCLTENATKLLRIGLFQGASNRDAGNNIDYASMNMGDYLPTAFMQFFTTEDRQNKNIPLATYFPRTPSDAPKTFTVTAPRHNTNGLFVLANSAEHLAKVEDIVGSTTNLISKDDWKNSEYAIVTEDNQGVVEHSNVNTIKAYLKYTKGFEIARHDAIKPIPGTENKENNTYEAYVTVVDNSLAGVVFRGTIKKKGKKEVMVNPQVEAVVNFATEAAIMPDNVNNYYSEFYDNLLKQQDVIIGDRIWKKTSHKIDVNHPVFKLLKLQFKQDMINAGVALSHYFEFRPDKVLPDGSGEYSVLLEADDKHNRHPKFKAKADNNRGYAFYHLGENGKVLEEHEDSYTLGGGAFHSNKFTLVSKTVDENGKTKVTKVNYLDALMSNDLVGEDDGSINLLYGGAMKFILDSNGNVQDVKFSDKQNEAIDEALSNFILDYIEQSGAELNSYGKFIQGIELNSDNIVEFYINQLIMHYNYDSLLEGDSRFYKDTQTILKRAKEYQGSGIPYGISDFTPGFIATLDDVKNYSFLNNGFIEETAFEERVLENGKVVKEPKKDENGNVVKNKVTVQEWLNRKGIQVTQRQGFTGVTIKNTKKTNEVALQTLKPILLDLGMSENDAMDMLYGPEEDGERHGGYTNTKVNDAQSYITFEEWIRRIAARGQLQRYMPLIDKLTDESKELTAKDLKEFVQVQKNFYYDLWYDDRYGIEVPRQIKNAEFVLVPRLIKGTELAEVYKMMKNAGIDQLNTVETSKAANEKVLTLWDNDGVIQPERYENFESEAKDNLQIYSYNNLYTQQETPQHMNAENKASLQVMKKIIDNLPDDTSKLGQLKTEFLIIYAQNIEDSHVKLLKDFKVVRDDKGNIKITDEGTVEGINLSKVYEKLGDEIRRTGMDSNEADYVTIPEGSSQPAMPSHINNYQTKFESVFQSLYNHEITRQTLPGFHAAQITNVGWRIPSKPLNESVENVSYSKDLRYHPNGEGYIEVKIPYSVLGIDKNNSHYRSISDETILAELERSGLDMILGYRIPTEGKQSMCNMKIVGFISDTYGSTIVVPDDWVSQTGSDFDIDSVYAIQAATYINNLGQVKKITYKDTLTEFDYFNYVNDNLDEKKEINVAAIIRNAIYVHAQTEADNLYNAASDIIKGRIKKMDEIITKDLAKKEKEGEELSNKDKYIYRLQQRIEKFKKLVDAVKAKNNEKQAVQLQRFVDAYSEILNVLENRREEFSEKTQEVIDKIIDNRFKEFNKAAVANGLMSYKEFSSKENIVKSNSREARQTRIFEIFKEILLDKRTLIENLSRSNFDKITEGLRYNMSPEEKLARKYRSPYNFNDQAHYQEEAMSGAKLKGISVMMDTWCSVCNVVKPVLEESVYIVYDSDTVNHPDSISERYDNSSYNEKNKTVTIRHNNYGYTKNNQNVDGMILTSYSSQTTAFILDAIKEGAIPNVNVFTFDAFKTLANIGCNYKTSIGFIMQPGIARIVRAYNANNSIFATTKTNPVHSVIREIAMELGLPINEFTPIVAVTNMLNARYHKEFNAIFKQGKDEDITISLNREHIENLPIIGKKCHDRLHKIGDFANSSPVEELLFDLGVVLAFDKLNKTSATIKSYVGCANPDKFGAKQSVYETRKVFEDIDRAIFDKEDTTKSTDAEGRPIKKRRKPALTKDGKHILASIYPGIDNEYMTVDETIANILTNGNVNESSYKTLFAFLKYASATSVVLSKSIFRTQTPQWVGFIEGLKKVLSGHNPNLDEATYKDFERYVLSSLYNKCPSIQYPVEVVKDKDGNIKLIVNENEDLVKRENYRVHGYEHSAEIETVEWKYDDIVGGKVRVNTPFNVVDKNNPTNDEVALFEQLSPAQKVHWIKTNFEDSGIFGLINVKLVNESARGRWAWMQTLEYIEEGFSSNTIYSLFKQSFENSNPLVVSAAIDIVKYAIKVEGMRMTATAVNKVIDNDCLINNIEDGGLGFVSYLNAAMADATSSKGEFVRNERASQIYENYLRSHPDVKGIRKIYLNKTNKAKYGLTSRSYGAYFLAKGNNEDTEEKNAKKFNELLESMGIRYTMPISERPMSNEYIRLLDTNEDSTLYKIVDKTDYVILYPLSNLLANEDAQWSVNEDFNHGIVTKDGYEALIANYNAIAQEQNFNKEYISEQLDSIKKDGTIKDLWYSDRKKVNQKARAIPLNLNSATGSLANVRQTIVDHFVNNNDPLNPNNPTNNVLYIRNNSFEGHFFANGIEYGSPETIKLDNGKELNVIVFVPKNIKSLENKYTSKVNGKYKNSYESEKQPILRSIIKDVQDIGQTNLRNVVQVEVYSKDNEQAMAASLEEASLSAADFAKIRMLNDGDEAGSVLYNNLENGQIEFNKESISENKKVVTSEIARFAVKESDYIKHELFDNFVKNPNQDGTYLSIIDDRVTAMIKKDANLRAKYFKAAVVAEAFRKKFEDFRDLDVDSEDVDIKRHINTIKESYDKVVKLPISKVIETGNKVMLDTFSTNPLIKDQLLDTMDAYWKTWGNMWLYQDIMENGTPIVQVMLKEIMSDIDAKQKMNRKRKKNFWNHIKDILARAKADGMDVNTNNIIDADGRTIRNFKPELADKVTELRKNMKLAIKQYGVGSIEHLKAKLEFDILKAKHFNQEASPEYYIAKVALEKRMLDNYPEIYSEYMKLYYRRFALYDSASKDKLSDEQKKELHEINKAIYNLVSLYDAKDEHGDPLLRPIIMPDVAYTSEQLYYIKTRSFEAAEALGETVEAIKKLNQQYFEYDSIYGFEDTLNSNLLTIQLLEKRDANGIPTIPQSELEKNPRYVDAVNWIKANAEFKINPGRDEEGKPLTIGARLEGAFLRLRRGDKGKSKYAQAIIKGHNDGEGIADINGIPDGRKLSKQELADIKDAQKRNWRVFNVPDFTDRILISNAKPIEDVFLPEFYSRMSTGRNTNPEYLRVVTELNKIFEKYYSPIDGNVHIEDIPNTPEGIQELKTIASLFQELRKAKASGETTSNEAAARHIRENVEFKVNEEVWFAQNQKAAEKGNEFVEAWNLVAFERNDDGSFVTFDGKFKPNQFLYTYAKPKGQKGDASYNKWLDVRRTEDIALIESVYRKTTTKYYDAAKAEAMKKSKEEYREWYNENHVYNPYTRKMQPLDCWITQEIRPELIADNTFEGEWVPKGKSRIRRVITGTTNLTVQGEEMSIYNPQDDKRNPNYNAKDGLLANYVKGSQEGLYDNPIKLNKYEEEMRDYLTDVLKAAAHTESARDYFRKGFMPRSLKQNKTTVKSALKEAGKLLGVGVASKHDGAYQEEIGYEHDVTPSMPMTQLLESKNTYKIQDKIKKLKEDVITKEQFNNEDDYNNALKEREEVLAKYEQELRKERQDLLNRDWYNVIDNFLEQAAYYNAVQDNKYHMYFLLDTLRKLRMYSRQHGATGALKKTSGGEFDTSVDDKLVKQFENICRRLLLDQWKEDEGKLTDFANTLQSMVSSNYMMLNLRGGVANVTLGETGILAEAAAGEFFGGKSWKFGTEEWVKGSIGFARSGYQHMFNHNDVSYNKQDAIIKVMNVVDYDEKTGVVRELTIEEYSKKIRDAMFSPQTIGEHFMQNSVLFAMLHSHKLVRTSDDGVVYMTKPTYIAYRQSLLLNEVLNEEQLARFAKFKADLRKDKDKLKDYAWFRQEALSDFIYLHCNKEQIDKFIKLRKEQEKKFEEEFDAKQNMYDQMELGPDGHLQFVAGSELAALDEEQADTVGNLRLSDKETEKLPDTVVGVTKAYALLGAFAEKTQKVNNKIHGVYNRMGAAYIERTWYGGLIMQYHKHLPIGIMKRYMNRGHWNEFRESVDKGMIQSVYDIARLNFRKIRVEAGLTDEQVGALEAFTFTVVHLADYLRQLKTTWDIAPAYDKANLMRNFGDAVGVVGAMATIAALWYIAQDDNDMQDSYAFNFFLYEADRLCSEAFMYNPIGAVNETKKLMSTPVAAQSGITDLFSILSNTAQWMFTDDWNPQYETGRFAGDYKIWIQLQRRIPMWHGIRSIIDTPDNNHYYKLGQTPIGFFDIKKHITED